MAATSEGWGAVTGALKTQGLGFTHASPARHLRADRDFSLFQYLQRCDRLCLVLVITVRSLLKRQVEIHHLVVF